MILKGTQKEVAKSVLICDILEIKYRILSTGKFHVVCEVLDKDYLLIEKLQSAIQKIKTNEQ